MLISGILKNKSGENFEMSEDITRIGFLSLPSTINILAKLYFHGRLCGWIMQQKS